MQKVAIQNMIEQLFSIPAHYELSFIREVMLDGQKVSWLRFKKKGAKDILGGEHLSVIFDPIKKSIKGMVHLDSEFAATDFPSEDESEKIAFEFLEKYAPDIANSVEIKWIQPLLECPLITAPHDEGFCLKSGVMIRGMRVKLFIHTTNLFGWILVGKAGQVIAFERDVIWDPIKKYRVTERWLRDTWLAEQNNVNLWV